MFCDTLQVMCDKIWLEEQMRIICKPHNDYSALPAFEEQGNYLMTTPLC